MSKLRLLVVDDAIFMRDMLKDTFRGGDMDVVGEAANGVEAVERFCQLQPDVTTMDIVMPYKSGIEATREIRRMQHHACIIMCSALGHESLVAEAKGAGAADFIVKPFSPEQMRAIVQKAWSQAQQARANVR
jgi:two-component system chemotaxis response regulator CheY